MEGSVTLPKGATILALPYISKLGFSGPTVSSLIFALINNGLPRTMVSFYGDYSTSHARNAAAQDAVIKGAEWLFFVDSDMDFPINTMERLKALDADVACTDMWSRSIPSFRTVMRYGPKSKDGKRQFVSIEKGEGVMDIDCCGMACTLIKTSLLRKFAKAKTMPFAMGVHGEDANFSILAKQKFKASMKCDFGVTAGHWGQVRMAGQEWSRDAQNGYGAVADPEFLKRMGARNVPAAIGVPLT